MAKRICKKGFRFAMDDYGRGSASLMEVIELPVYLVKLDAVLWRKAVQVKQARWVFDKIVMLFKSLGIHVMAEGIGRRSDLKHVRELGLNMGQGFALGRPLSSSKTHSLNPRGRLAGSLMPASSNPGTPREDSPRSV
jgi:EAL domain-containing protein (putative c-di-GMP-specific phosphodiesterase class I)